MQQLGAGFATTLEVERELVPADVYDVGSMLAYDERQLLHWAARTGPRGAIVDLGSFLGGSTLALASGAEHRDASVDAYDRFRLAADWERHWLPGGTGLELGESTRPVVERNIARVLDRVTIHEGDVENHGWDGSPIGVLFVDITKSWAATDFVWQSFMPALVPDAVVIQQDLVHWGHPWCAVLMEHLHEHFEYLGWVWFSSAVYRCISPPPPPTMPLLDVFSCEEMSELVARAARRVGEPGAGEIRLSAVGVYCAFERYDQAREVVGEIARDYDNDRLPYIEEGFETLTQWIDDVEAGRRSARE
jgi:hypothetical protein